MIAGAMTAISKNPLIIGNWKMYKTAAEAVAFVQQLISSKIEEVPIDVALAVPFTAIAPCLQAVGGAAIQIGAQNMNDATEGAFTGEIAGRMLKEAGASFVLLGHSERRHLFHESSALIRNKVERALKDSLLPVLCVGETHEEKELGKTEKVLEQQLRESLEGITLETAESLVLAYEPVWAIGTQDPATADIAQERQAFCRSVLASLFGEQLSEKMRILYGGSVKPENAASFIQQKESAGLLVGGASLSVDSFCQIIKNAAGEKT